MILKNRNTLRFWRLSVKYFYIFAKNFNILGFMDIKEIGKAIKDRRKALGVNQQTLSELSGVATNTLVAVERGEGNPQLQTLLTVLDTLGLQIDINLKQLNYEKM